MVEPSNDEDSRQQRRAALLKLNTAAWAGEKDLLKTAGPLDSSLKKNTAFIKRLRTSVNADNQAALLKEISTLTLEKYLSEIIGAAAEGFAKCRLTSDIWAAVEVTSALHQRFAKSFTPTLMLYLLRGFASPTKAQLSTLTPEQREKEDNLRLIRQRGLLRLLTEYWLCGIARTSEDARIAADSGASAEATKSSARSKGSTSASHQSLAQQSVTTDPIPLEVLREILGNDTKEFTYLPLASAFVKNFGSEILGVSRVRGDRQELIGHVLQTEDRQEAAKTEDTYEGVMNEELRKKFRAILESYNKSLQAFLVKQRRSIKEQEKRNNAAYMRSGEIFEDRHSTFEKMVKAEEKMIASAQVLADALEMDMPDLTQEDAKEVSAPSASFSFTKAGVNFSGEVSDLGIWEDEEQKKFYEELLDLRLRVPQEFFSAAKKAAIKEEASDRREDQSPEREREEEIKIDDDGDDLFDEDMALVDDNDGTGVIPNPSIGAQVDLIIHRLPEMNSRETTDQLAIDFCYLNSKASRIRLIRAVQGIPKTRQDLVPMYSRFIATLNKYIPDIGTAVVKYLQREFKVLVRKRTVTLPGGPDRSISEARARNIRYIAELVKFKVVPNHVTFNCIKILLDGFGRHEIETLSNLLESCGRFLLRTEETHETMAQMLEIMWKKKSAQNLDARERILLENAFYYVNPPERPSIVQKERSVIEQYVRKLVLVDLNKRTYHHILKQFRKLNWEDPESVRVIDKTFTKIWKVKYGNIHLMTLIASCLMKYHQDFIVRIVDSTLEHIRVGLELNMFKYNQQRIAHVKYLGEMYNYRIVDSPTIFDTLYTIVGFGHEGGRPQPGRFTPLDPVDDYFRIRLVCTLLETCAAYFDRGSAKKKLDLFLGFFQYYVFTKLTPLPMEIEFNVHDTLQMLRPNLKVCSNLEEAATGLTEAMTTAFGELGLNHFEQEREEDDDERREGADEDDDDDAEDDEDDEAAAAAEGESGGSSEDSSGESSNDDDDDEEEQEEEDEDEEEEDRGRGRSHPVEDEEFDREFSKMLAESLESRKSERRSAFDVPLPVMRSVQQQQQYSVVDMTGKNSEEPENRREPSFTKNVQFRLLTKRGNRQQIHTVEVPADSAIAVSTRMKQKAEQEERQRIKNLVLNYERSG
ncbi:armadillo-type protein [Lipomyces orientalis]|uniref:Armadillo-type protein n=1 Tax=Lipomyces orientalis TaxID=1233043 RepID=A0ACC3TN61_9ASCO